MFPGLDIIVSYSGLESILLVFPGLDSLIVDFVCVEYQDQAVLVHWWVWRLEVGLHMGRVLVLVSDTQPVVIQTLQPPVA